MCKGEKSERPNITYQAISVKIMADSLASNFSFPEGLRPSAAATKMPAEDSGASMSSPRKKRAFGPPVLLSREPEQIDSGTRDPLSLESEDEPGKHVLLLYSTWN